MIKPIIRYLWNTEMVYHYRKQFGVDNGISINGDNWKYLVTKNYDRFYPTPNIITVEQCLTDYRMGDIQRGDTIVDVGANVGGFTIPAARLGNVYAYEPILCKELKDNLKLNALSAKVYDMALSNEDMVTITWQTSTKTVKGIKFKDILKLTGGIDFLKMDCEGGEWDVDVADMSDIRCIEMELHYGNFSKKKQDRNIADKLRKTHDVDLEAPSPTMGGYVQLLHARLK